MKTAAIFMACVVMFFAGCATSVACFMAGKCTVGAQTKGPT